MTTATVDQALALARQLPARERARLIALIAQDLAIEPAPPALATGDPWAALFATMDQVAASPALAGARSATAEATESRR
ncbi:MAG: hypothetical protein HGA65_03440 [Oscillochloris sp.]|nr:hypothetical protein [Oscillochloris sp.]